MTGAFMICMEMFGNGSKINGMIIIMMLLQTEKLGEVYLALIECFGVAAGAIVPGFVDQRSAAGTSPTSATKTLASVS
jgi:hypothetical protein